MKRHINIPIFIPHMGCKNQCVFCNQKTISGTLNFDITLVDKIISEHLSTVTEVDSCEIAFFGGSFTGIDRDLMLELLTIADKYVKDGSVSSIRCSTRPDYIDENILDILNKYNVKTIELGLQSCDDRVLELCKRGHSVEIARQAAALIKAHGFKLGGQMMIGLPGSDIKKEIQSAEEIIAMGCDETRIYPTIVFQGTELCDMTKAGQYVPITVSEAVARSAEVFKLFVNARVRVLRIGLCDTETIHKTDNYYAGPLHPAIGEMVISEYYYNRIAELCRKNNVLPGSMIDIIASSGETSKIIGQKGNNRTRLFNEFGISIHKVYESFDADYELAVVKAERS